MNSSSSARGKTATRFRTDINGLRALSVATVVLFHVAWPGAAGGFIGVDIFFVISGFLMTRIIVDALQEHRFSYIEFLISRAARIWPAMAAMVLSLLILGSFLLPPSDLFRIAQQGAFALFFWSNQFFHDHAGYATGGADSNWLLHTWSLSVEWQFYLLYPALLFALFRSQRLTSQHTGASANSSVTAVLLACAATSFSYYVVASLRSPNDAFFLLPARVWELLAGGLVALHSGSGRLVRSGVQSAASYGGLAVIVVSVLWIGWHHLDPVGLGALSAVPVAGAMLVLWADYGDNVFFKPRAIQSIGLWSYSIYLWHWPIVAACATGNLLVDHAHPAKELVVLASVVLGYASYRFVEPLARTDRLATLRRKLARPMFPWVIAVAAVWMVVYTGGLAFRDSRTADAWHLSAKSEEDSAQFPEQCSNFQKVVAELRTCQIDRPGPRRVLVIGDSHAEHLYPWFQRRSMVSVDFLAQAGCPPVPNFERMQAGFHCRDYAAVAWSRATDPQYDTVIVSAKWNLVGGAGPPYCHGDANIECQVVAGSAKRDIARAELRSAIGRVLAAGKTLVILAGSPASAFDVPKRIDRELFLFGRTRMIIDRATVSEEYEWVESMFADFAGQPRFHVVSLLTELCDKQSCKVFDETLRRPVFADDNHFDAAWMVRHGGIFAPFVQPLAAR